MRNKKEILFLLAIIILIIPFVSSVLIGGNNDAAAQIIVNNTNFNTYNINGSLVASMTCSSLGSDYVLQDFDNSTGIFTCVQVVGGAGNVTGVNNYTLYASRQGGNNNLSLSINGMANESVILVDSTGDNNYLVNITGQNNTNETILTFGRSGLSSLPIAIPNSVGPIGPQGLQGIAGTNGTNGINGVNGTNGIN